MKLPEKLKTALENDVVVARRFYELFFERCPEAKPLFREVVLREQVVMLQVALLAITQYPNLSKPAASYLKVLGTRHHRAQVPKELFPGFRTALIDTLAEFCGGEWNPELQQQWEAAFEEASSLMFQGYEQHFST